MLECELFKNIPSHVQKLNNKENVYELENHIGEEVLSFNLLPKLGEGKNSFCKFS